MCGLLIVSQTTHAVRFFPFSLAGAGAGLKTALHRLTASSHCKLDLHRLTASSHKRKCKLELHRLTNASRTIVSQTQVQLELLSHTRWRVHRRRSQDRRCPVWVQAHIMPRKPLLHCCCTAAALLLHCCCTAAALLLHCCHGRIVLLLLHGCLLLSLPLSYLRVCLRLRLLSAAVPVAAAVVVAAAPGRNMSSWHRAALLLLLDAGGGTLVADGRVPAAAHGPLGHQGGANRLALGASAALVDRAGGPRRDLRAALDLKAVSSVGAGAHSYRASRCCTAA